MSDVGDQINKVVDNLSNKLGVAAKEVYPVLIKQAYIDGIVSLIAVIITVALIVFSAVMIYQYYFKKVKVKCRWSEDEMLETRSKDWDYTHMAFWGAIGSILFASIVILSFNINTCLTALMNPKWYVMQMILDKVTGK